VRKQDDVVLWPAYFDSTKTRAEGRRVPKKLAKPSPTLEMIVEAINDLGLKHRVVPEAAHPHFPRKKTGFVLVKKVKPKNRLVKDVASRL